MKNKGLIYKISISAVVLLSVICNFLPILSADVYFAKYSISAVDFFNMSFWKMLGDLSSDTNFITVIKTVIAVLIVFNLLTLLVSWLAKKKHLYLIGVLDGVVQTGLWAYLVIVMLTSEELKDFFSEQYLSIGIAVWGFIVCGLAMLVLSILLFRNEGVDTVTNLEGGIIGLTGEYAGARIPVGKTPVVIGRDQNSSNVILQDNRISRQHCSVVYDASRKIYIVRDFSSNGTFLEDGSRLKPNQVNELPSGTQVRVGEKNVFVLQ